MHRRTGEKVLVKSKNCLSSNQILKHSIDKVDYKEMDTNAIETEKVYECDKCFKKFVKESHLKMHMRLHRKENENKCNFCQRVFKYFSQLKYHLKHVHLLESMAKPNICDICEKEFQYPHQLENHIKINHIKRTTEKAYECSACTEIFDIYDIDSHVQIHMSWKAAERSEVNCYKCCVCYKMFAQEFDLKEHYAHYKHKERKRSIKSYKCVLCFRKFHTAENLKTHMRVHTEERPFTCNFCIKTFKLRGTWKRHERMKHRHVKSANPDSNKCRTKSDDGITVMFDCGICQESFPEKTLLLDHSKVHKEVGSFECNICKNTFDQSDGLKFHLRKCHVNEQNLAGIDKVLYECDNCKETFEDDNDLNIHLKTYMNEFFYDSQVAEMMQINSVVEHFEVQSTAVVNRNKKIPVDINLLLKSSQRSVEVVDGNFQDQNFVRSVNLLPPAVNAVAPVINSSVSSEVSNFQMLEGRLLQPNRSSMIKNVFVSPISQSGETTVEPNDDTALPQIEQKSDIAMDTLIGIPAGHEDFTKRESSRNTVTSEKLETDTIQKSVAVYTCGSYKTMFGYVEDLTAHVETERHNPGGMMQDISRMTYTAEAQVLGHKSMNKQNIFEKGTHKCAICLTVLRSKKKLFEHNKLHRPAYQCEICKKQWMRAYKMKQHLLSNHVVTKCTNGTQSYECEVCKTTFKEKSNIEIHVTIHINNNFGIKVAPERNSSAIGDKSECNSSAEALGNRFELRFQCITCLKTYDCENEVKDHTKVYLVTELYFCSICKDMFLTTYHLSRHLKVMHVNKKPAVVKDSSLYECDFCEEVFTEIGLDIHLRVHIKMKSIEKVESGGCSSGKSLVFSECDLNKLNMQKDKYYECDLCLTLFTTKQHLKTHWRNHNGIKPFTCIVCKQNFVFRPSLRYHLRKFHCLERDCVDKMSAVSPENPHKCTLCKHKFEQPEDLVIDETFPEKELLMDHKKIHAGLQHYECAICRKGYNLHSDVIRHLRAKHVIKKHAIGSDILFECFNCKESFKTLWDLDIHLETYAIKKTSDIDGVLSEPYKCNLCEQTFGEMVELDNHLKIHNSISSGDNIPVESDKYENATSLFRHDQLVKDLNEPSNKKMFDCEFCGKSYTLECYLKNHVQSIHEKKYECNICQQKYYTRTQFTLHKGLHDRKKLCKCDFCDKVFPNASAFSIHKKTHSKFIPFKCNVCKMKFLYKNSFVRHKRLFTGSKHHVCVFCHKLFRDLVFLKTHYRFHTREKPFECIICLKQFYVNWMLLRHEKLHSPQRNLDNSLEEHTLCR